MRYAILCAKALLTLAFLAAGGAKLAGAEMMLVTYDAIGVGQWFRYLTGGVEIAGAALLWVCGREAWGAAILAVTMVGAALAHLLILGPSAVPAFVLGGLSAFVLYAHREQLTRRAALTEQA
ncbi:MAG: DoxX family protein [Rhodobacteraceae bacterium]|nr:DoxX family protein [Paracoccaceae bacterium]